MYFTLQYIRLRACLKKAFCKMCVTILKHTLIFYLLLFFSKIRYNTVFRRTLSPKNKIAPTIQVA